MPVLYLKMIYWYAIVVQTPAHSPLACLLTYHSDQLLDVGSFVRVPLGSRELLGVVWGKLDLPPEPMFTAQGKEVELKAITAGLGIQAVSTAWLKLVSFTASYYQRSLGEVALAALPPQLRTLDALQVERRLKRQTERTKLIVETSGQAVNAEIATNNIALQLEQTLAIADISIKNGPFLLFGATGSGKTEVYLHAALEALQNDPAAQVLMMVPEINLTPQLEDRVRERICPLYGDAAVVSLHSGMTNPQRLKSWLSAHMGTARVLLGTRMAIFASMPNLKLIVVDEEHDPSYKSQEGARYSARDLAVYRGKLENAKVILGSATPSFESWHHSRTSDDGGDGSKGRYVRLTMAERIGGGVLPKVITVNMEHQPKKTVLSPPLLNAIAERIARGEQAMLFLNRRGFAPVLHCGDCGWKSECPHCSAYRVFHKIDRTLRCHHCGFTQRVPRACPACGNLDITTIGRGTEQLEENLADLLAHVKRPDGAPVKISRIDADTTKLKGALQQQLAQVHSGEVDVLVGTQMIAKGHDFRNITLVAAINPDGALFSSDFRAPERLFSLLMQAAGRAGRDASQGAASEMWIQTHHPQHPLYQALKKHDYAGFAAQQLKEREMAAMSPFGYSALVRAEARTQEAAQAFLTAASESAADLADSVPGFEHITLYPAVPMTIQRIANVERAQMLVESHSRKALQQFLSQWQGVLQATKQKGMIRWAVDVDPLAI
jgi:primosomal protein N' (replication factor Y) (superfamily II helicase)